MNHYRKYRFIARISNERYTKQVPMISLERFDKKLGGRKMKLTRRKFLESGTSALTISAGLLLMLPQNAKGKDSSKFVSDTPHTIEKSPTDSLNTISNLSKSDFVNQIGTRFDISSETTGLASITLARVEELPECNKVSKKHVTEGYSLSFHVKNRQPIIQDSYFVNHPTLGTFQLLLVPVLYSESNPIFCYEAIINHLA